MIRNITLVLGLILSFSVFAHQATTIKLAGDGNLVGLPNEYLPANFDRSSWTLSIADKKYVFPACVSNQLSDLKVRDFKVESSWYNPIIIISDTETHSFPSYIKISVKSEGFYILLDLDTTRPFDANSPEYSELAIDEICGLLSSPNKNSIIDSAKNASQNK
jgi:hypothetical protein